MKTGPKPRPLMERFLESIELSDNGCWIWTGMLNKTGYGLMAVGSRSDGTRRKDVASRVALTLAGHVVTPDLHACHHCDNPPCVNPSHLFLGTRKENMQDALHKGRLRQPDHDRTRCRHGHEYTEENTAYDKRGYKFCRQCRRRSIRDYYWRNPEKVRAIARENYRAVKSRRS